MKNPKQKQSEANKRFYTAQKERGLRLATVWIPQDRLEDIKQVSADMREAHFKVWSGKK